MSENTILFALYRMGYHSKATGHGFRATASTILNEHGSPALRRCAAFPVLFCSGFQSRSCHANQGGQNEEKNHEDYHYRFSD